MTTLGRWPLMIVAAGLFASSSACSFLTRMEGTFASGRTFSGDLDGRRIAFKAKDGLECHGFYEHGYFGGVGRMECSDGRTGAVSLNSLRLLHGPGHGKGRGEGMIGDEKFEFFY